MKKSMELKWWIQYTYLFKLFSKSLLSNCKGVFLKLEFSRKRERKKKQEQQILEEDSSIEQTSESWIPRAAVEKVKK